MSRLLRIELRRNALLVLMPVVALLWLASPIARHLQPIALWPDRSTDIQSALQPLCPFTAGTAAWMAYRERRREVTDLLATTPLNPARRALAVLAATIVWAVLGYATGTTAVLIISAHQATWGHPIIWPMLVGLLAVITAGAVGFGIGRVAPSRFTAPLVAIGMLGLLSLAAELAFLRHLPARMGPLYPTINLDKSVFYPIRTDLAIVQLLCLTGILLAALALIVLHTGGGRRLGLTGAATGTLLVGLAAILIGTAHTDQLGATVVPALDSVESPTPLPYTPVCSTSPLPVCVHPAYAAKLSIVDSAVNALARPLFGTPGAPVRAHQQPDGSSTGAQPELIIPPLFIQGDSLTPRQDELFQTWVVTELAGPPAAPEQVAADTRPRLATDAQRAVALYLVHQAGGTADPALTPATPPVQAAADRLAALPERTRHTWLTAHITQVRAGTLTLADLP